MNHTRTMGETMVMLREERELKQKDVAKVLGKSASAVSLYEHDSTRMSYDTLLRLSDFFGVSPQFILGESDDRDVLSELEQKLTPDCTVGEFLNIMKQLNEENAAEVVKVIDRMLYYNRSMARKSAQEGH